MLQIVEEHACFDGVQRIYRHESKTIGLPMRFSAYLPPQAKEGRVPVLFYLAGLTCTEETFPIKAGAQRHAAQHGLALIAPDGFAEGDFADGIHMLAPAARRFSRELAEKHIRPWVEGLPK